MSDSITIARPYAKAIFKHALSDNKLSVWSIYLQELASLVMDSNVLEFLTNPSSTADQHSDLLKTVGNVSQDGDIAHLSNLIEILSENKRLLVLPEILALYEIMRADQEKTLEVNVISSSYPSDDQQKKLIDSLSQRLKRKITLNISLDETIIGGAVIRAGDLVIDGSIRGKLNKLRTGLAA